MRMLCFLTLSCLTLAQAADAGVVGGGGGPPAVAIETFEFNRITADLLENKKTFDLELQGLRLRPQSVDMQRLEIHTQEVDSGEAVILFPGVDGSELHTLSE